MTIDAKSVRGACVAGVAALTLCTPLSAQWPVGQGNYWVKATAFYHRTEAEFRSNGDKEDFLNDQAVSRSNALFLDGLVGVTDRLDFWVQVPYFDLSFDDVADNRSKSGVGDIRLSARYNLLQLRGGSIPISARFTAKVPVGEVLIDAEVIPVGQGQWDYEAWLESGLSLWPLPVYSTLWLGYRWRTLNEETTRRPGDEFTFLAEVGATNLVGGLGGKIVADAIFGRPGANQGIELGDRDKLEIFYIAPTALYAFSPSTFLELGVRVPIMGQNFPAGSPVQIGLFHQGSLF